MSKPYIHSLSSVRKWGGKVEDYLPIHNFIDSSKSAIPSNIHRVLTHNSWFAFVIERIKFPNSNESPDLTFPTITNSDGKVISTREIFEQHVLEDFKGRFIPSAQDYLQYIEFQSWMQNGDGYPPSYEGIKKSRDKKNKKPLSSVIQIQPNEITYDRDIQSPPFGGNVID